MGNRTIIRTVRTMAGRVRQKIDYQIEYRTIVYTIRTMASKVREKVN